MLVHVARVIRSLVSGCRRIWRHTLVRPFVLERTVQNLGDAFAPQTTHSLYEFANREGTRVVAVQCTSKTAFDVRPNSGNYGEGCVFRP